MTQFKAIIRSSLFLVLSFISFSALQAFEKLPEKYTITLGSLESPNQVIEYFSLSCPLCLKLLKEEFPGIYNEQINQAKVCWTFHPDPQDITTMQLLICLEKLPQVKKWPFFSELVAVINPSRSERNTFLMQELVRKFAIDLPFLHDISWIETTSAYKKAFEYIKQKDAPSLLPAIEVNGTLKEGLPTQKYLREVLQ